MPAKNPWQHDVIQLNNKGLDVIHPIEQVDAEHYSRMEDVKSLQEGTITPRPGTSLINASALAVSSQPVQQGQVRTHGDGTSSGSHSFGAPNFGFTTNLIYLLCFFSKTASGAANVSNISTAGGTTWVQVATVDFNTIASPNGTIEMWRAKATTTTSGNITWTTDIACPTFASIHEFTGCDLGGSNGADAIVQASTTAADLAAGTSLTTTLNAFGSSNHATFAAASIHEGSRTFTPTAPMVEIYEATSGLSFTTLFYEGNDTTPETVVSIARDNAIIAVELKNA